jgi:hypothetical protein
MRISLFGYVVPKKPELKYASSRYIALLLRALQGDQKTLRRFRPFFKLRFCFSDEVLENLKSAEEIAVCPGRWPAPVPIRSMLQSDDVLGCFSCVFILLSYHNILDKINDGGIFDRMKFGAAKLLLRSSYRKASEKYRSLDEKIRQSLDVLAELEAARCPSIDETAETFSVLLSFAAAYFVKEEKARGVTAEVFEEIGRWIYLMDANERHRGRHPQRTYNPVLLRFAYRRGRGREILEKIRETMDFNMTQSLSMAAKAYEILAPGPLHGILHNILYEGLPARQRQAFTLKRGDVNGSL